MLCQAPVLDGGRGACTGRGSDEEKTTMMTTMQCQAPVLDGGRTGWGSDDEGFLQKNRFGVVVHPSAGTPTRASAWGPTWRAA